MNILHSSLRNSDGAEVITEEFMTLLLEQHNLLLGKNNKLQEADLTCKVSGTRTSLH